MLKTSLCSFCHWYDQTIKHILLEWICVEQRWNHLRLFLTNDISLPIITPQTAIFGFINGIENNVYKITNYTLLIFKLHVYKSRERGTLELSRLKNEMKKVKLLEKKSTQNHLRKLEQYNIKREKTHWRYNILLKWKFIDILLKTKHCFHLGKWLGKTLIYTEKMFCCV